MQPPQKGRGTTRRHSQETPTGVRFRHGIGRDFHLPLSRLRSQERSDGARVRSRLLRRVQRRSSPKPTRNRRLEVDRSPGTRDGFGEQSPPLHAMVQDRDPSNDRGTTKGLLCHRVCSAMLASRRRPPVRRRPPACGSSSIGELAESWHCYLRSYEYVLYALAPEGGSLRSTVWEADRKWGGDRLLQEPLPIVHTDLPIQRSAGVQLPFPRKNFLLNDQKWVIRHMLLISRLLNLSIRALKASL